MSNEPLLDLYDSFFKTASTPAELTSRLSCPLLLSVGSGWHQAIRRLLVVGKETFGWDWTPGDYYPWPHPPLTTLADFNGYPNAVRALVDGYASFAFSKHQSANFNGPFWRAFRQLHEEINEGHKADILWTNLFRCDLEGGSVIDRATPAELNNILAFQHGLLSREIRILSPTAVVFFTGPNYDLALRAEFPDIVFAPVSGHVERQFCQIAHPDLPTPSFRFYHPNYLARNHNRWLWLREVASYIATSTAMPGRGPEHH